MKPFEFAADPGPVLALSRHAREREGLPLVPMKRVLATLGVLGGVGLAALFEAVWPLTPTLQKASDRLLLSGREWTCVSLRETPGSDPEQPSASSKTDKG